MRLIQHHFTSKKLVVGLDEAGRGCLAGPVVAAAVILPKRCRLKGVRDSKKLTASNRLELREQIQKASLSWCVTFVNEREIDEINILQASITAMQRSIDFLHLRPDYILVDGNRFRPYQDIEHECVIKGDDKYLSIAAASILAKTYRDDYMESLHAKFPNYGWNKNKGYPTKQHRNALKKYGLTDYHRLSYGPCKEILNESFSDSITNKKKYL